MWLLSDNHVSNIESYWVRVMMILANLVSKQRTIISTEVTTLKSQLFNL